VKLTEIRILSVFYLFHLLVYPNGGTPSMLVRARDQRRQPGLNFATSAKSSSSDTNCIISSDLAASFSASKSLAHRSLVLAS